MRTGAEAVVVNWGRLAPDLHGSYPTPLMMAA